MIFTYYFTVDHVHDGDTIYGVLDLGLGHYLGRAPSPLVGIRFYGINTPELSTPEGKLCRDYLKTLVVPGVVLKVDTYSWDKYSGRVDGVPYLPDPDNCPSEIDLCGMMLNFGHGTVEI